VLTPQCSRSDRAAGIGRATRGVLLPKLQVPLSAAPQTEKETISRDGGGGLVLFSSSVACSEMAAGFSAAEVGGSPGLGRWGAAGPVLGCMLHHAGLPPGALRVPQPGLEGNPPSAAGSAERRRLHRGGCRNGSRCGARLTQATITGQDHSKEKLRLQCRGGSPLPALRSEMGRHQLQFTAAVRGGMASPHPASRAAPQAYPGPSLTLGAVLKALVPLWDGLPAASLPSLPPGDGAGAGDAGSNTAVLTHSCPSPGSWSQWGRGLVRASTGAPVSPHPRADRQSVLSPRGAPAEEI